MKLVLCLMLSTGFAIAEDHVNPRELGARALQGAAPAVQRLPKISAVAGPNCGLVLKDFKLKPDMWMDPDPKGRNIFSLFYVGSLKAGISDDSAGLCHKEIITACHDKCLEDEECAKKMKAEYHSTLRQEYTRFKTADDFIQANWKDGKTEMEEWGKKKAVEATFEKTPFEPDFVQCQEGPPTKPAQECPVELPNFQTPMVVPACRVVRTIPAADAKPTGNHLVAVNKTFHNGRLFEVVHVCNYIYDCQQAYKVITQDSVEPYDTNQKGEFSLRCRPYGGWSVIDSNGQKMCGKIEADFKKGYARSRHFPLFSRKWRNYAPNRADGEYGDFEKAFQKECELKTGAAGADAKDPDYRDRATVEKVRAEICVEDAQEKFQKMPGVPSTYLGCCGK